MEIKSLEAGIQTFALIRHPNNINEKISDLLGLRTQKQILHNLILTAKNFLKLEKVGLNSNISALLYGPPGVGKTALARAICRDNNAILIEIQPSRIFESYFGETLKNITSVFKWIGDYSDIQFKQGYSTVLFIDEFDSLARERADPTEIGEMKRAVNELLRSIDFLMYKKHSLVILASTNHELTLDSAAWRRFLYHIHFPLPTVKEREAILEYFFNNLKNADSQISIDLNFLELANKLDGYSPSDIERLVRSIYIEYLSLDDKSNFKINNQKVIQIMPYIGGTREHLEFRSVKNKTEIINKDDLKKSKSYTISPELEAEFDRIDAEK